MKMKPRNWISLIFVFAFLLTLFLPDTIRPIGALIVFLFGALAYILLNRSNQDEQ